MAKRFIDTVLLDKDWIYYLTNEEKLEWFYLMLKCDSIGVYVISRVQENTFFNRSVDWISLVPKCSDNLEMLDDNRVFITNWCSIQYGDRMKNIYSKSPPIMSHQKLAKKHGLYDKLCLGYQKVIDKTKEEEEEEEKDKDEEEYKEVGEKLKILKGTFKKAK